MIPKIIHYCWFGGNEKPKLAKKCIESWKKYCPDYEIKEWNETNFDINMNGYTKMCIENKKWAFLSDYARLIVVFNEGGIYFDTDVELIKPIDELLNYKSVFGFENNENVATGLGFFAEKGNEAVRLMIKEYDKLLDGKSGTIGCPILNTAALKKIGLQLNGERQSLGCAEIFPADYFNPCDSATGKITITENTYSIHRYAASWQSAGTKLRTKFTKPLHRIFGTNLRRK